MHPLLAGALAVLRASTVPRATLVLGHAAQRPTSVAVRSDGGRSVSPAKWVTWSRSLRRRTPHRGRARPLTVDLLLGTRYYYVWQQVKTNIAVAVDTPIGSRTTRVSPRATASPEWADPVIGARWSVPLLDRLNLEFRGDIGGFELASDLAWSLLGVVSYDLPWRVGRANPSLVLGYKALSFDYENGNDGLALTMHGLVSGVRFYF